MTMFEPTASSVEAEGKGYIVAAVGEEAGEMPHQKAAVAFRYLRKHLGVDVYKRQVLVGVLLLVCSFAFSAWIGPDRLMSCLLYTSTGNAAIPALFPVFFYYIVC